jgi:hypothetical protein
MCIVSAIDGGFSEIRDDVQGVAQDLSKCSDHHVPALGCPCIAFMMGIQVLNKGILAKR